MSVVISRLSKNIPPFAENICEINLQINLQINLHSEVTSVQPTVLHWNQLRLHTLASNPPLVWRVSFEAQERAQLGPGGDTYNAAVYEDMRT